MLTASADIEITQVFKLTEEHILFFLRQFKKADFENIDCQKRLIATFVNSIYLYDDKIVITFNYSGNNRTVSLAEVDNATEGDLFGCCASLSAKKCRYPFGYLHFFLPR